MVKWLARSQVEARERQTLTETNIPLLYRSTNCYLAKSRHQSHPVKWCTRHSSGAALIPGIWTREVLASLKFKHIDDIVRSLLNFAWNFKFVCSFCVYKSQICKLVFINSIRFPNSSKIFLIKLIKIYSFIVLLCFFYLNPPSSIAANTLDAVMSSCLFVLTVLPSSNSRIRS